MNEQRWKEDNAWGAQVPGTPSLRRAWYALVILSLIAILGITDRQMLTLAVEPLKRDFRLSDTELGLIVGFGPILFSAIASPLLGWLADRVDRRWLMVACILVWSAGTAACGLVTQSWMLFLCTLTLAVGEAGLGPVVYSLLPDLFPARLRTTANTIFFAMSLFGAGLGIAGAGAIFRLAEPLARDLSMESWRLAFLIVAVPGPLIAALFIPIGHPRRGGEWGDGADGGAGSRTTRAVPETVAQYWRRSGRVLTCLLFGYALSAFYVGAILGWAPVSLIRYFHVELAQAGMYSGIAIGGGSLIGVLAGAFTARALRPRFGHRMPVVVACAAALTGAALLLCLPAAATATWLVAVMTGILAAYITGAALTPTLLQDVAPPHLRGRVIGASSLITYIFQAISVPAVGVISDALHGTPNALLKGTAWLGIPAALVSAVLFGLCLRAMAVRTQPNGNVRPGAATPM